MVISSETILINSTFNNVFILSYYDGIKEEVDIDNLTLYLWYDYASNVNGEYWLKIKSNTVKNIIDYLNNSIGIKDLIDKSTIEVCIRLYEKYFELRVIDLKELNGNIILPENVRLGYNFIEKLKGLNIKFITSKTYKKNSEDVSPLYFSTNIDRIKKFAIKNINTIKDDYYCLLVA